MRKEMRLNIDTLIVVQLLGTLAQQYDTYDKPKKDANFSKHNALSPFLPVPKFNCPPSQY
jgi:hypothetical protein